MKDKEPEDQNYKEKLIEYWIEKAHESMEAAQSEYASGRQTTAVRNLYYACFYALTAVLLKRGRAFKKHTAVKAALHQEMIKPGLLEPIWGKFYNRIFDSRHEGDYQPLRSFEAEEVKEFIDQADGFLKKIKNILSE